MAKKDMRGNRDAAKNRTGNNEEKTPQAEWQKALKELGKTAPKATAPNKVDLKPAYEPEPVRKDVSSFADFMSGAVKKMDLKSVRERGVESAPIVKRSDLLEEQRKTMPDYVWVASELAEGDEPPRRYCADESGRQLPKDLIKGKWRIVDSLDLHGFRCEEAQEALNEFVENARQNGAGAVEIVHGAGVNSKGFNPKLKKLARLWLIRNEKVLAYAERPDNDGSSLVLLKNLAKENRAKDAGEGKAEGERKGQDGSNAPAQAGQGPSQGGQAAEGERKAFNRDASGRRNASGAPSKAPRPHSGRG